MRSSCSWEVLGHQSSGILLRLLLVWWSTHKHTHTRTHTHTHKHTHTHTHTHSVSHTCTHAHTHTRTHAHIHDSRHTHTHTDTHTHTRGSECWQMGLIFRSVSRCMRSCLRVGCVRRTREDLFAD